MRIHRIFEPQELSCGRKLELNSDSANHVGRVLRLQAGEQLWLFNGQGGQYLAEILAASKKSVTVELKEFDDSNSESPLAIHLGQVISRGERMEFVIQKAVELGVTQITPLFSERCGVKLTGERLEKKIAQWQKIAVSACEQCGRNKVPAINSAIWLKEWVCVESEEIKLTLHPRAEYSINTLPQPTAGLRLLIGPEGGFSDEELQLTEAVNFTQTLLGPRVLRTETAALTAITALQCRFGDLG